MRPTRIPGADPKPLGAPRDWKEDEHGHCGALFIRREKVEGVDYMRSAWEIEPGEAACFAAGARLILGVQGHQHPVVHLAIGDLPPDFDPFIMARKFITPCGKTMARVEMTFPHGGGRRAYSQVPVGGSFAQAVAAGVSNCEDFARAQGWIE